MNVVLRTDGNSKIGIGHVMRCLALAQNLLKLGHHVLFVLADSTPSVKEKLSKEQIDWISIDAQPGSIEDASKTISMPQARQSAWVIADGYSFGSAWQKQIKNAGLMLLILDDYGHAEHYHADLILNQNAQVHDELYTQREPYTQLLLGTSYVLLRSEFDKWRGWHRTNSTNGRKVLLTFGASDPGNISESIVKSMHSVPEIEALLVVGGGNPHFDSVKLQLFEKTYPWLKVAVNVDNMAELIAWADVAVSACGSTVWELCFMQLPTILLVCARNQEPTADYLMKNGLAAQLISAGRFHVNEFSSTLTRLIVDQRVRARLSTRMKGMVDGRGSDRVITRMLEIEKQ